MSTSNNSFAEALLRWLMASTFCLEETGLGGDHNQGGWNTPCTRRHHLLGIVLNIVLAWPWMGGTSGDWVWSTSANYRANSERNEEVDRKRVQSNTWACDATKKLNSKPILLSHRLPAVLGFPENGQVYVSKSSRKSYPSSSSHMGAQFTLTVSDDCRCQLKHQTICLCQMSRWSMHALTKLMFSQEPHTWHLWVLWEELLRIRSLKPIAHDVVCACVCAIAPWCCLIQKTQSDAQTHVSDLHHAPTGFPSQHAHETPGHPARTLGIQTPLAIRRAHWRKTSSSDAPGQWVIDRDGILVIGNYCCGVGPNQNYSTDPVENIICYLFTQPLKVHWFLNPSERPLTPGHCKSFFHTQTCSRISR